MHAEFAHVAQRHRGAGWVFGAIQLVLSGNLYIPPEILDRKGAASPRFSNKRSLHRMTSGLPIDRSRCLGS
jgi:hypothetical protein